MEILEQEDRIHESVYSGKQKSSIVNKNDLVQIVFNRETKQLAIKGKDTIDVFTP